MRLSASAALTLTLFATQGVAKPKVPKDAILLSNVKTLTLRAGQQTSSRRVSPIPQLQCVGGSARGLYDIDVLRCHNSGSEYDVEDVAWKCQASLPPEFKLGATDVVCEGYDGAEDPYVLKGSCGVEYRLVLTEMGEEKYQDRVAELAKGEQGKMGSIFTVLFWAVFVGIVGFFVYQICVAGGFVNPNNNLGRGRQRGPAGGGGAWGGDDDGHDDPPPPYTPRAPPRGKKSTTSTSSPRSSSSRTAAEGWRPGFWTGAATGAAAGYAMGNLNGSGRTRDAGEGPSSWFNTGARRDTNRGGGGSNFGGVGPSSSPATPSSSRYESTGFGGTTRR